MFRAGLKTAHLLSRLRNTGQDRRHILIFVNPSAVAAESGALSVRNEAELLQGD
jgi:hypothetical protein